MLHRLHDDVNPDVKINASVGPFDIRCPFCYSSSKIHLNPLNETLSNVRQENASRFD